MKKIAVYGSLKKGFYNYRENMGEPIAHGTVRGSMYLASSYPHLYREEVSEPEHVREHAVEVYEVADDTYAGIEGMELGAGYQVTPIDIGGHECIIFYTRDDHNYKRNWIEEYSEKTVPFAMR